MQTDPWYYLSGNLLSTISEKGYLLSGIYVFLRTAGIVGCIATMLIALIKCASSNPQGRAEAKSIFTKKVVTLLIIFLCSYIFGTIYGILITM